MQLYHFTESRSNKLVRHKYDLLVVGGGLSGICASIAAARQGIRVALIQDRPVLGGNASSEVRVWALGATSHMGNNNRWAREGGIIDEIMVENMHRNKEGNPLYFDSLLLEKVLDEPLISLFLNTIVFEIEKTGKDRISAVKAFNSQNSTLYHLEATYFCDASGDGILGYLSGAAYRVGAEDAEEFHEGFSPSEKYGSLLGHTLFLYHKKTGKPVKYIAPHFALKDISLIPKIHQATPDQFGCNYWWFEYGGLKDTIYDSEEIKQELWKIVYGVWNHIKNSGLYPEAEDMTLEWVGTIPGKRESRRFEGLYMLNQHDIIEQRHFEDAVSYGGWAIDLHPAEGVYSPLPSCNQYHSKGIYSIPYRAFVCRDIKNLFLAGRLISASHVAFGSTRVMITCAHGGQVVGSAAALCVKKKCFPTDLLEKGNLEELQYQLNWNGQSIPHVAIKQDKNLLSEANLSASSSLRLGGLSFDGDWRVLDCSIAQLLPLQSKTQYSLEVEVKAVASTELVVELAVSSKKYNYTPDLILESRIYKLEEGTSRLLISFTKSLQEDQYAFIIFKNNESIYLRTSKQRLTGVLSLFNKFNKSVNNWGRQMPPPDSGFEEFDFFTPERRPEGSNLAFRLSPEVDCFEVENIRNGFLRPYIRANAWVADWSDEEPFLKIEFGMVKQVKGIKLYFDTDMDHPMETIQWNHPENDMPFCVADYEICDDKNKTIVKVEGNYQTINHIDFEYPVLTSSFIIRFKKKENTIPVSLFEIEMRTL